jgi:hypothetical protein
MNSNKIIPSTRRIICDNMLHLIKREAEQTKSRGIRHSFNFDDKVVGLIDSIERNIDIVKSFQSVVEKLQSDKFTADQMRQLVQRLFPDNKNQEPSTRLLNKRESIYDKFANGIGNEGRTKWDALNAITEYESRGKFTPEKLVRTLSTDNASNRALALLAA